MNTKKLLLGSLVLTIVWYFGISHAIDIPPGKVRDPSHLKVMIMHYPSMHAPEPYTYPGPSPSVKFPPRATDSYSYIHSASQQHRPVHVLDYQSLPKWCKSMWEREECGMKCWMLRKICRNISQQTTPGTGPTKEDFRPDSEGSQSIHHPQFKPYFSYFKKPLPAVTYSKSGVHNTYFAQPSWQYPHIKRSPYSYYRYHPILSSNEIGLNPQFTYVDGYEKLNVRSTTEKSVLEDKEEPVTTQATITNTTTKPEDSKVIKTDTKLRPKGAYPVKVILGSRYPPDSEVTTLSPLMFEYDQYGTRGYYGDRVYMSAMMPVSDRQHRRSPFPNDEDNADSFDDFDEMMIEP